MLLITTKCVEISDQQTNSESNRSECNENAEPMKENIKPRDKSNIYYLLLLKNCTCMETLVHTYKKEVAKSPIKFSSRTDMM